MPGLPDEDAYEQLCFYTLAHGHPSFIHQHVVDAYAAQHADEQTKPIMITFALVGLYLHLEKGFNGRQVQLAHMKMGKAKHVWPRFALPKKRGALTPVHVMQAPAGPERDQAIDAWCASVWQAFAENRPAVAELLRRHAVC